MLPKTIRREWLQDAEQPFAGAQSDTSHGLMNQLIARTATGQCGLKIMGFPWDLVTC